MGNDRLGNDDRFGHAAASDGFGAHGFGQGAASDSFGGGHLDQFEDPYAASLGMDQAAPLDDFQGGFLWEISRVGIFGF